LRLRNASINLVAVQLIALRPHLEWSKLATSRIRVLVVDDFEAFRSFVCSALKQKPQLELIGEASDGAAAVQKAEELSPDLILLDIGLPRMSGIHAAREIFKLLPNVKIIFLTQESDRDVVQETLRMGAKGYVLKARAANDLIPAMEAVLQGKRFVSREVAGHWDTDTADAPTSNCTPSEKVDALERGSRALKTEIPRKHEVLFAPDDEALTRDCTRFITAALHSGKVAIAVATESHLVSIREKLLAQGVDVAVALETGRYFPLDVAKVLSRFMVNGVPDEVRFQEAVRDLIRMAAKSVNGDARRISACGECAPTLLAEGLGKASIRIEQLWDGVARTEGVEILCVYRLKDFRSDEDRHILQKISAEHSAVYPGGRTA
jgi:DNA-binding NarL/FixJ family response regulator